MKTDTGMLAYYTEYVDSDGKRHYAVHKYRRSDGWVWSMRDYKFHSAQCSGNGTWLACSLRKI